MDFRTWLRPFVVAAGLATPAAATAQGGHLEGHWEAYAALGSEAAEVRRLRVPISFQFTTRSEGHDIALTDVHVKIRCSVAGTQFEAVSDGPFLIATLPEGRYDVVASHEGRTRRIALVIDNGEPKLIAFRW